MVKNSLLKTFGKGFTIIGGFFGLMWLVYGGWGPSPISVLLPLGLLIWLGGALIPNLNSSIQIIIIATPFVVFSVYFINQESSSDTYLIPRDFRGKVHIYYGQKNGTPKEYKGFRRIYRVPDNGILLTQFEIKESSGKVTEPTKYMLVEGHGSWQLRTCEISGLEKTDTSNVYVINGGIRSTKSGACQYFYIGKPTEKMKAFVIADRNNASKSK